MINLQVKRSVRLPVDKHILVRAVLHTLESENAPAESDVSVVIADDTLVKKLNLQFRRLDETTDVLSFPSSEFDPDTKSLYLGDVIVSLPRAQDQALTAGHTLEEELQLLIIHGTLHLLGYDHLQAADRTKMQAAQDNILKQLGVNLGYKL